MLVIMVSTSVAVFAPEALPVLLSSLHNLFLLLFTKLSVYKLRVFEEFQEIGKKFQISGSQIHLALAGTVIGLIILALRIFSLFTWRDPMIPNKPSVSAAIEIARDFKAQSESESSEHVSVEKTPCFEKQDPPNAYGEAHCNLAFSPTALLKSSAISGSIAALPSVLRVTPLTVHCARSSTHS